MTSALQHFWAGRWDDALAELSALADQSGEPGPLQLDNLDNIELRLPYHGLLALIAVCRDDRDTVRRCPKHGPVDGSEILSVCDYGDLMCAAHARSAERSGDLVGAVASLGPIAERPPGRLSKIHHWLPDLVRIALAAGDDAAARAAAARCEAEVVREPTPARVAALHHCRGLMHSEVDLLVTAERHFGDVGRPVQQAQVLEDVAVQFAAQNHLTEAKGALDRATQIYWELGADWSLRRAHTRLRPFGVRPRTRTRRPRGAVGWEALSPAELAVAHLVAEGRSNREIAAELFLARGTVESHVSHILGKLGAHSRIAIARAVMDHPHEVSRKA